MDLSQTDAATARSRGYLLLGRLFLRGVTDDVLDHVRAVEPLADHVSAFPTDADGELDRDEAGAAHHDVFGFNVFPYQSTFIDETSRAGGDETERVADFYREAGFPLVQTAESPDHVGVELNFLGFLSKMEAENTGPDAEAARDFSRRFLDEHLLQWFTALRHALHVHEHPFYRALADVTAEMLIDHRRALAGDGGVTPTFTRDADDTARHAPRPPSAQPDPKGTDMLDDERTGLRDIAEYLLVPAHAGIYLSRATIRALSRTGNLPAGFGARDDMMSNLLNSAADYDGLERLTDLLIAHTADTRAAWEAFGAEIPDLTGPIADKWIGRLDDTEQLFDEIRSAAVQQQLSG